MLVIGILEASGVLKVSFPIWHVPLVFSYGENIAEINMFFLCDSVRTLLVQLVLGGGVS